VTNQEIDDRIAKKKGKEVCHCVGNYCNCEFGVYPYHPTTDWRLAGELVIESKGELRYSTAVKQWRYAIPADGGAGVIAKQADTPQMAICLAFLEWNGE